MTTESSSVHQEVLKEKQKLETSNGVIIGSLIFLTFTSIPFIRTAYFNMLLDHVWDGGWLYVAIVFSGCMTGVCMAIMAMLVSTGAAERIPHKELKKAGGWAVLLMIIGVSLFPAALLAARVDLTENVISVIEQSEKNLGHTIPYRATIAAITKNTDTLKAGMPTINELRGVETKPKELIWVMAGINALPPGHQAGRFVVENGMARKMDILAIQVALMKQVREGDQKSKLAYGQ